MFVRVVRFTDVDPDRVDRLTQEIDAAQGPPPGVKTSGLQILLDREQRTAVVVQRFDSAEDMADSEAGFDAMDPSETPGTRASVDRCEVMLDLTM